MQSRIGKIKTVLKIVFAASIIWWLLENEKLDFSLITQSIERGHFWIVLGLIAIQGILATVRWRALLEIYSKHKLGLFSIIKISWIGLFFNNFLPGAVTGDFIKLIYIRDLDKSLSKTYLVTSVLMDRIFGLVGLLCIMGVASLLYYGEITSITPQVKKLVHFNLFLFTGAIFFLAGLFAPARWQEKLSQLAGQIPLVGKTLSRVYKQICTIGKNKNVIAKSMLLSISSQLICCFAFYLIGSPFYPVDIPLGYIFSLIPLGLITVAIPVAPAGIGLGHMAFEQLFGLIEISGGANYFNLYFLCQALVNSLGILPYILNRKQLPQNEL